MDECDANELKAIADRLLQKLRRCGQATPAWVEKVVGLYTLALEFHPRSPATLLSRARAHDASQDFDLAYVDAEETLELMPTCTEASRLKTAMIRRLVPQGVCALQAKLIRSRGHELLQQDKLMPGIHLLFVSLKLRWDDVGVLLERANAHRKCKRFDITYVDACEAEALLDPENPGKPGEEAVKTQRDALAQFGKFKLSARDPSLTLSKFSSWMSGHSMQPESMLERSTTPTLDASALFIVIDSARLEGPAMSPRCLRLLDLPRFLNNRVDVPLREVLITDLQVDAKCLSLFHLVSPDRFNSLDWLMLDAVDFRRLSADDFKSFFNGGPDQGGVLFSAKSVSLSGVQMPSSLPAGQLLQLRAIRDANDVLLLPEFKCKQGPPFLLPPAAIATCLADKRRGCFKLVISADLIDGSVPALIELVKKNFIEAKRRVDFQLTVLCAVEGNLKSTIRNSMQETLSVATKTGPFLYDSPGSRRVVIHRYK